MVEVVVEDGTGVVTANSYLTTQEADAILEYMIHADAWHAADLVLKQKMVIWASEILDTRTSWNGCKVHETSGLAWPRSGVRNKDNVLIEDNVVPREVKVATAILANHIIGNNPNEVNSQSNLEMIQADVVALRFDPRLRVEKYPEMVGLTIAALGRSKFGFGGPKYIRKH